MTNKSKNDGSGKLLLFLALFFITLTQLFVFGLMMIIHNKYLRDRYYSNNGIGLPIRRINDFSAVYKPLTAILFGPSLLLFVCIWPFLMYDGQMPMSKVWAILLIESPIILIWLWLSIIFIKWLVLAHFGVIVDPGRDRIVFRFDQESYDFSDYLKLKFIRDLPKVDEVPLSGIGRITRRHGADIYLLGTFGSRRITFTNKQKRDECIFAITSSGCTKAKVAMEFERT
jgi:hypothetical protein